MVNSPRAQGYAVTPAWRANRRYWLAWPNAAAGWGDHLDMARESMAGLASLLSEHRPVSVLANAEELAEISLMCGPGVAAMVVPHVSCCIRAVGPTFLERAEDGGRAGIAWTTPGGDAGVAKAILDHLELPLVRGPLPLVPTMVDVDGEGTCLASEALLVHAGDRVALEKALGEWLGVEQVVWLRMQPDEPLERQHLLRQARFLAPGLVVAGEAGDDGATADNLDRLRACRDAKGRTLELVTLPAPRRRGSDDDTALPLSYANCFADGSLVIVPAYEDGRDEIAYDRIVAALPDHTVVSFPALEFAHGGSGMGTIILSEPGPPAA